MRNRKFINVLICIILLSLAAAVYFFNKKEIMISSNMKKGIEKYWKNEVVIREVKDFEAYGKKYKLVLSTVAYNEKYKYLNCYEEKLNGLYYKNYEASEQGGSKAQLSFSTVYVDSVKGTNKEKWFTVVYGYNKELKVDNYTMKISGHSKNIVSSITGKQYFIDAYEGRFEDLVSVTGKAGEDMIEVFHD